MFYLYYDFNDNTFLLCEMRTNPPYEACITTEEARAFPPTFWSKHLPTRNETLDIDVLLHPYADSNWSDECPSISLLCTFNTLEDYFNWADQDHPELFV